VSVTVEDSLPTQPTIGSSVYRPLGGDGWTAPHALYSTLQQLTGDGGGGTSTVTLNLDTRFMNIVALVQQLLTGFASSREGELQVVSDRPTGARHRVRAQGAQVHITVLADQGLLSWNPPLLVDAEAIVSLTQNTDGDIHNVQNIIYCFQKRALEEVPLNVLLASLPSVQFVNTVTSG